MSESASPTQSQPTESHSGKQIALERSKRGKEPASFNVFMSVKETSGEENAKAAVKLASDRMDTNEPRHETLDRASTLIDRLSDLNEELGTIVGIIIDNIDSLAKVMPHSLTNRGRCL